MGDLIDRQAAIDYCYQLINVEYQQGSDEMNYGQERVNQTETILHHLELMPSARPERTCVNCGRTANNGGWYADGRTRCPIEEHYALPKDGYCHLWEKRNVTDDDYPERRTDGEIIPE
jgi:hypothetical protein